MTIRQTLFLGFSILIAVFLLNFFIDQKLSTETVTNSTYLSRSEEVIRNSNLLHKNMIDMQNGFRGYLLTEQDVFLQPYDDGLQTIPLLFVEQRKLISTILQKARLDTIQMLHEKWIEYARALIDAKKDTLPEATEKYKDLFETKLKMEEGKKINDEIRLKFADFDKYEYTLRQTRRNNLRESITRTRNISILLTVISITIAIVSCFLIINIILKRINQMVHQASDIAKGSFKQTLDHKNDEFKKLSESLNAMSEILDTNFNELTNKNKELDQFAYVVSHDLKAPLRGIDNITKWLDEDHSSELSPEVRTKIELIKGRVSRLENMINGLLEFARIGRTKRSLTSVDVQILLDELVDMLVPESFSVTIEGQMPTLITEKLRLEQVFGNIISNAVKYNNKDKGQIIISSKNIGEYYEFMVSDNGPGISPNYHEKIFMIFQTLKERDAFESTGVGLAIVKKIIDDQKGKIVVKQSDSGGTTFVFTWPNTVNN